MWGNDDQRSSLQWRSHQVRQAKDSTNERNHSNTMNSIKRNTNKRAAVVYSDVVYSDANHLAQRSKKPRVETTTTKGEEAGVRNPGRIEVVQKAYKDDDEEVDQVHAADNVASMMWSSIEGASDEHSRTGTDGDSLLRENLMVDSSNKSSTQTSSLPVTLLRSSVENGEANERLEQGFDRSLRQPCSKEDAAADARIQKLEQELHMLEEELKNENQLLWEEDAKLHANAVHNSTREATARANGTYRARWTTMVRPRVL
jgi:CheY-like chemotaxis protein